MAKIWVRAGESKYIARLSLYGSGGEGQRQLLLGRGYLDLSELRAGMPSRTFEVEMEQEGSKVLEDNTFSHLMVNVTLERCAKSRPL